jgi:hypothetical protein
MKRLFCGVAIFVLCLVALNVPASEKPLTNDDVVAMIKAGLGDDLVIAKIGAARELNLDTSSDALIKLRKAGVSKAVLDAMIRGGSGVSASTPPVTSDHQKPARIKTGVRLVTKEREYDLMSIAGEESSTNAYVMILLWNNYPGLHAEVRTKDRDPYLLLQSDKSPTGRFYLVRLDSNDKSNDRSLKMGRERMFTSRSIGHPDNTWTIAYEATQEREGLWRLKPKTSLTPDEYGLWMGTGELYNFGVD